MSFKLFTVVKHQAIVPHLLQKNWVVPTAGAGKTTLYQNMQ